MGDVMRRLRRHRQVAARQLVLALRAGLDHLQPLGDREVDRLVVADLEMQEGVVLDAAPVAAVKRVRADEVDRAGDVAAVALGHDQQHVVGHALADQREEFAVEVGPAPFAAAGVHVEGEELVPGAFGQVAAGQPVDRDAVGQRLAALLLQRLALARGERGEEIVVADIALVEEMELLVGAAQEAGALRARRRRRPAAKVTCAEETPSLLGHRLQPGGERRP